MVPDKFNMVDMGGIDLIMMQGEEVPGLYDRLVESIAQCRYQCLYNWLFDGVIIPPTYVEMEVGLDEEVRINEGVVVTSDDVIHIYSIEPPPPEPVINPISIVENGTYYVPEGVDGFNPVTVDTPITTQYIIDNVGFYGTGEGQAASSLTVSFTGYRNKYAIIAIMHRASLTAPSGVELLDSRKDGNNSQWVSIYKYFVESDSTSLTFVQGSSARICGTVWAINLDYDLEFVSNTEFQYFLTRATVETEILTYFIFNATYGPTFGVARAASNGAWMCTPTSDGTTLRHFSGVIYPTTGERSTNIYQISTAGTPDSYGNLTVYEIKPIQ